MYYPDTESEILKELYKVAEKRKKEPVSRIEDVVLKLLFLRKKKIENVVFLLLDNANKVIKKIIIKGTVDQAVVYPREIVKECLLNDASAIIMAHNHPGGKKTFSINDITITNRIRECLKLFEISLLDHVLICNSGHNSLRNTVRWLN